MILKNLAFHAPEYVVLLDQAIPDAGTRDLEKAGILETLYAFEDSCYRPRLSLVLTEKGQALASSLGWRVYRNTLVVPLGRFVYVPNSALVDGDSSKPVALTFTFRYAANKNAAALLAFGRASDWDTGDGLTLADVGQTYRKTVPARYEKDGGWSLEEEWSRKQGFVC